MDSKEEADEEGPNDPWNSRRRSSLILFTSLKATKLPDASRG